MSMKKRCCRRCGLIFSYNDMVPVPPKFCSDGCAGRAEISAQEALVDEARELLTRFYDLFDPPELASLHSRSMPKDLDHDVRAFFRKVSRRTSKKIRAAVNAAGPKGASS